MKPKSAALPPDEPAQEAGFLLPADPHAGLGGSYLINPETGERELVERTEEVAHAPTN